MIRRPPRSTRTDTLFPYTTLFRSIHVRISTQMATHGPAGSTADPGIASFVQVQLKPHLSTKLQMSRRTCMMGRSEESRVGKECVSTCRSRWSPYNSKTNHCPQEQQNKNKSETKQNRHRHVQAMSN